MFIFFNVNESTKALGVKLVIVGNCKQSRVVTIGVTNGYKERQW